MLAATTAYQTDDLLGAAERLGVEVVLGTDRCRILAADWPQGSLSLDFRRPERAAKQLVTDCGSIAGIVATDEQTALIAALAAERLGLRFNPVAAARATADKLHLREALAVAGVAQPGFVAVELYGAPPDGLRYPVVIKPRHLSTSRGVMRADDAAELAQRFTRLRDLLEDPEVAAKDPDAANSVLVEQFVPGAEVAFEGLMTGGELRTLALFDKPDPLDGPFFAETIYVTPSQLPAVARAAVEQTVAAAAQAIQLVEGPVHAELRLGPDGPVVIEVAARSIGGLCGRALKFGAGIALEELIIAHAIGRDLGAPRREDRASGVLMLPAEQAGVLRSIDGVAAAEAVDGVREVAITARVGDTLVPLPEGHAYLGFIFAAGEAPDAVVDALRAADRALTFRVSAKL